MVDFFDFRNCLPTISYMIKTNTTSKKSPTKKAPVTKTSAAKKPAPKKSSAPLKTVAKSAPPISQATTVAKKSVSKKAPAKKVVAKKTPAKKIVSKVVEKITTMPSMKKLANSSEAEGVKMLGILHLAANLLSGGTLGLILVVLYYFVQKNKLSALEKETCFEIINFNLSFIIYAFIASALIFILIGFILIPIVLITWLVLMVVGFLKHMTGENYKYPFIIRFIS